MLQLHHRIHHIHTGRYYTDSAHYVDSYCTYSYTGVIPLWLVSIPFMLMFDSTVSTGSSSSTKFPAHLVIPVIGQQVLYIGICVCLYRRTLGSMLYSDRSHLLYVSKLLVITATDLQKGCMMIGSYTY